MSKPTAPGAACTQVLIAEDDAMFRRILKTWLEGWGYQVTVAEDGARAWELMQEGHVPQILILDWMMPKLNGIELCRKVREKSRSVYQYILLVTAKDQTNDLVHGLEAGADDYLSKPFDRNELRARLRTGGRILTLQDEQTRAREEFQFQATHDALTGMWNRRAILDLLRRESELAARSSKRVGIMMLDVDHFKSVNDRLGHLAGDAVLQEIGRRVQMTVRSYDLAGRYGGEEFLIVSPDCDQEQIQECAERVRLAIAVAPILVDGVAIAVTASLGAAVLDPACRTERDALAAADSALYEAKRNGRNRVAVGELKLGVPCVSSELADGMPFVPR
ncbi:GGDEF domain-containing response regulator [Acidisarcina polymorpha]|nr:diguanylate cyclase [Acidisarcina polymorpha]